MVSLVNMIVVPSPELDGQRRGAGGRRLVIAACLDCRRRGCLATTRKRSHDGSHNGSHERFGLLTPQGLASRGQSARYRTGGEDPHADVLPWRRLTRTGCGLAAARRAETYCQLDGVQQRAARGCLVGRDHCLVPALAAAAGLAGAALPSRTGLDRGRLNRAGSLLLDRRGG